MIYDFSIVIINCCLQNEKSKSFDLLSFWRHHPDLNRGVKVLQTSALPLGYGAIIEIGHDSFVSDFGADYGARTRHLDLGKVALYQMS